MNVMNAGLGLTHAVCDQFFCSNFENMKIICKLYDEMTNTPEKNFNRERRAFDLLIDNNVPINLIQPVSCIFDREVWKG